MPNERYPEINFGFEVRIIDDEADCAIAIDPVTSREVSSGTGRLEQTDLVKVEQVFPVALNALGIVVWIYGNPSDDPLITAVQQAKPLQAMANNIWI